jgi:hypothetical protein
METALTLVKPQQTLQLINFTKMSATDTLGKDYEDRHAFFWVMTHYSLVGGQGRFGCPYHFHLQGFNPQHGNDTFLRSVGSNLKGYVVP